MKKTYVLSLTVSVIAIFFNASASAQSWTQCQVFEFVEIQSMSKSELEQLYCKNKWTMEAGRGQEKSAMRTAAEMAELGSKIALNGNRKNIADVASKTEGWNKEATKFAEHADACSSENNRVLRVIKKGNDKVEAPKCERPKPIF